MGKGRSPPEEGMRIDAWKIELRVLDHGMLDSLLNHSSITARIEELARNPYASRGRECRRSQCRSVDAVSDTQLFSQYKEDWNYSHLLELRVDCGRVLKL